MTEKIKRVSVQETMSALSANPNAILIDVREWDEIKASAPSVGKAFPMSEIDPNTFAESCGVSKKQPIFLFCRSGNRSMRVATVLSEAGFTDLTNVEGGILAWTAAGLPVKK